MYVWMLTDTKLHKVLHSYWPVFVYRRMALAKRGIGVTSISLQNPRIYVHQGKYEINQLYQGCRLLYGDILYIPVEKYHRTMFQLKIRNGLYLCQLLGVRKIIYKYSDSCKDLVHSTLAGGDTTGNSVEASMQQTQTGSSNDENIEEFPRSPKPHIHMSVAEFRNNITNQQEDSGFTLCPAGFLDHMEVRNVLISRLVSQLNEITLTLEEDSFDKHETKAIANVQSLWQSTLRYFRSSHTTFQLSFHLWFYPVEELLDYCSLQYTPQHFDLIKKSNNMELLDDFISQHLHPVHLLRYKSYKLLAPDNFRTLLSKVRMYENIHGFLIEFLDTVSLSGLLSHDDEGFHKASDLWVMIYKHFKQNHQNQNTQKSSSSTVLLQQQKQNEDNKEEVRTASDNDDGVRENDDDDDDDDDKDSEKQQKKEEKDKEGSSSSSPETHTKCLNIRCKNTECITCAQRTLFSYFLRVYNLQCGAAEHNEKEESDQKYILAKGPETELVKKMRYIIYNLKHFPNYQTFAHVVVKTLHPFSGKPL
jgi:hypothetical protein